MQRVCKADIFGITKYDILLSHGSSADIVRQHLKTKSLKSARKEVKAVEDRHTFTLHSIHPSTDCTRILGVVVLVNGIKTPMSWLDVVAKSRRGPHTLKFQKVVNEALWQLEQIQTLNSGKG